MPALKPKKLFFWIQQQIFILNLIKIDYQFWSDTLSEYDVIILGFNIFVKRF